jgi:hypothetical protein
VRAVIQIQAWWTGVSFRRNQLKLFQLHGKLLKKVQWDKINLQTTKYADYVTIQRATNVIRQFIIWMQVKQRIKCLKAIADQVAGINQKSIVLEQTLYHNLA